jgi:hypothetical protein
MNRDLQLVRGIEGAEALEFKGTVRTRGGALYDPTDSRWSYRDGTKNVSLNFEEFTKVPDDFVNAAKATLVWYAENSSPSHLKNMFERLLHFVRETAIRSGSPLESISAKHLINYKASLAPNNAWFLSSLAGLIRRWHRLGYSGVDEDAILLLKQLRLQGNRKGEAVLTMDEREGPFTYLEVEALQAAVNDAYAGGLIDRERFVLAWLYMLLGQRNAQHAALKVCDVRRTYSADGSPQYAVMMPRAKQGHADARDAFTKRPLIEQFGEVLFDYANSVRTEFRALLTDAEQAPLFPSRFGTRWSEGYEFHKSADEVGRMLTAVIDGLEVMSERTGEPMNIMPVRFRRTIGTRAAEEGHGPLVIAGLLDQTDTQQVMIYSANSPAIIDRIDRGVAMSMAPLAQAFSGTFANGESESSDPSKRIIDLRIDQSGAAMGECGQHGYCGFNAPIACYTCKSFEAWLDGPHEAVLSHLMEKRERLLKTSDKRIASINDRTIFGVAAVIRRCEEIKRSMELGSSGG